MKSEQEALEMLASLSRLRRDDELPADETVAQQMILAWMLEILPEPSMGFHNALQTGDLETARLIARGMSDLDAGRIRAAIEDAIRPFA